MMVTLEQKPLGQLLLNRGLLAAAQLDGALEEQRRGAGRKRLGEILVESRLCTEEQIAEALADSYGVPFARVTPRLADPAVVSALPPAFLEREQVLPLFLVEGVLTVAVAEPANLFLLDEIARLSGHEVRPVAATARDIAATLRAYLPDGRVFVTDDMPADVGPDVFSVLPPPGRQHPHEPAAAANPARNEAAGRLIHACLYNAIRESASDVHVEPAPDHLRIRYRIDGRLVERFRPPAQVHGPLVARLKAMAGLDPAQRRVPQQGTIPVRVDGRTVELRVSFAPASGGEKAVVHVGDSGKAPARLEKLGFGYDALKQWRRLIASRSGLLVVTGPAGSGKRTTLYSSVRELNLAELNVCTVEDPIERVLEGVSQFQVDAAAGFDADAALRAVLAQSPDVLMVPELSDPASARRAAGAAAGGCLVLTSVHAPDAAAATARLLGLGVEPTVLHGTLAGVLSQRIVRRLCQECREPYEPGDAERKSVERYAGPVATLCKARPDGCPRCHGTGYAGRIGVYELFTPDDAVTDALARGATSAELREAIRRSPTRPLRADAAEKTKSGVISTAEWSRAILQ